MRDDITVSRRIAAPAERIFALLTDPTRHRELDGSGMLRGAVTTEPITGVGDVFVMRMHYAAHGDYEMNNHVVEYDPGRRVAWEPRVGRGHPDAGTGDPDWGHRWGFALRPDGPAATIVTEFYDCSTAPPENRKAMDGGRIWLPAMTETLSRLATLVS